MRTRALKNVLVLKFIQNYCIKPRTFARNVLIFSSEISIIKMVIKIATVTQVKKVERKGKHDERV